MRHRKASVATEDRRNDDEVVLACGRVGEDAFGRQRRRDDVVAEDALELDRLCRRRDGFGVDLGELGVLIENVVQLTLEAAELLVGEPEAREVGDVLDVSTGQAGHAADDTGGRLGYDRAMTITATIRAMTPADVDPASDMIVRGGWGDRGAFFAFAAGHAEGLPIVAQVAGE